MRKKGLEPLRYLSLVSKTSASTNFAIFANVVNIIPSN